MKRSFLLLALLPSLLAPSFLAGQEAEKTVITEADQLPRVSYPFTGSVSELLDDEPRLQSYLTQVRSEVTSHLERYQIEDPATVREYLDILRTLDFLEGEYDAAIEKIEQIRAIHSKPADRLTSGLVLETIAEIYQENDQLSGTELAEIFQSRYAEKVNALPWELVQDSIEQTNGVFQYVSRNLYLGRIDSVVQKSVDENGALSLDDVAGLASTRLTFDHILPLRDEIVAVTSQYIAENRIEKADIWETRDVDLTAEEGLSPVVIAVWDSGVDADIFLATGQMWINPAEQPDGTDNDDNGFVDDIHGPAWDLWSHRTTGNLYPLSNDKLATYDTDLDFTKGLIDLQSAVDSEEAAATRQRMTQLERDEFQSFVEGLSLIGNYTHGTHVAGIASAGNPAARILNARITFGHTLIPEAPTLEEAVRNARAMRDAVEYFKEAGVRVVNMSWGGTQAGIEGALEANGVGDSPEHRAEMARVLFGIGYDALVAAMESAPDILFIPAAGNSDSDVAFNKVIPSSIDLPNVLVVGAVDQAGEETGFTSYGENIRAHASGFEIESFVPGGRRLKFSGTSMAAPNTANLAGKLLAIDPTLRPAEVIALIELGIDRTEDGRRFLLNPKRSVALLRTRLEKR